MKGTIFTNCRLYRQIQNPRLGAARAAFFHHYRPPTSTSGRAEQDCQPVVSLVGLIY